MRVTFEFDLEGEFGVEGEQRARDFISLPHTRIALHEYREWLYKQIDSDSVEDELSEDELRVSAAYETALSKLVDMFGEHEVGFMLEDY